MQFSAANFFPLMEKKRIDVIGLGVSNTELVFRLCEAGAAVTVHDRRTEDKFRPATLQKLKNLRVNLSLGESYLDDLDGDIIFRTPGLHFNDPALVAAREKGKVVTSELEVFLELCPCKTFGITGSDGKTTTASLIAEMLKKTGKKVHLGGNIGRPLLPILDKITPEDYCVVELSSFQLISMRSSPDIAVLTNLSPNHLDVHKTMEEYVGAKLNILTHQNAFSKAVVSADNAAAFAYCALVRGRLSNFSRRRPVANGAFMNEEGDLFHSHNGNAIRLLNKSELKLPGLHNVENFLAATAAVWGIVSPRDITQVAHEFAGVEHRIEFVREKAGVRYYNDSIATTPTRTIAGLVCFERPLTVILGGYDKHIPFDTLAEPLLRHAKTIILMGTTAEKIELAVTTHKDYREGSLQILHARDLPDAVLLAEQRTKQGDIVTLSPACASFDAYQNFEERGRHFKELVNAL